MLLLLLLLYCLTPRGTTRGKVFPEPPEGYAACLAKQLLYCYIYTKERYRPVGAEKANRAKNVRKTGSFSLIERVILSAGAMLIFSVSFQIDQMPEGMEGTWSILYEVLYCYKPILVCR